MPLCRTGLPSCSSLGIVVLLMPFRKVWVGCMTASLAMQQTQEVQSSAQHELSGASWRCKEPRGGDEVAKGLRGTVWGGSPAWSGLQHLPEAAPVELLLVQLVFFLYLNNT